MLQGTYMRLHCHVSESNLSVIRKARKKIAVPHRKVRGMREARHAFYREMIRYHLRARRLAQYVIGGPDHD